MRFKCIHYHNIIKIAQKQYYNIQCDKDILQRQLNGLGLKLSSQQSIKTVQIYDSNLENDLEIRCFTCSEKTIQPTWNYKVLLLLQRNSQLDSDLK